MARNTDSPAYIRNPPANRDADTTAAALAQEPVSVWEPTATRKIDPRDAEFSMAGTIIKYNTLAFGLTIDVTSGGPSGWTTPAGLNADYTLPGSNDPLRGQWTYRIDVPNKTVVVMPDEPATQEFANFSAANYFDGASPTWTSWTFISVLRITDFATAQYLFTTIDAAVTVQGVGVFLNVNGINVVLKTSFGTETRPVPFALSVIDNGLDVVVAVTYDRPTNKVRLYVNDAEVGTGWTPTGTVAPLSGTITVGQFTGAVLPWKGSIISLAGTDSAQPYEVIAAYARTILSRTSNLIVPRLPGAQETWIAPNGTFDHLTEHGAPTVAAASITWLRYFRATVYGDSTDLGANALLGGYPWVMRDAYVADGTHYSFVGSVALRAEVSGLCIASTVIDDFNNAGAFPIVPEVTFYRTSTIIAGPAYNDLRAGPVAVPTVAARLITELTQLHAVCPWVRVVLKYILTADPGSGGAWPTSNYAAYAAATSAYNDGPDGRAAIRDALAAIGVEVILAPPYVGVVVLSDGIHPVQGPTGYDKLGASMLAAFESGILPAT